MKYLGMLVLLSKAENFLNGYVTDALYMSVLDCLEQTVQFISNSTSGPESQADTPQL